MGSRNLVDGRGEMRMDNVFIEKKEQREECERGEPIHDEIV